MKILSIHLIALFLTAILAAETPVSLPVERTITDSLDRKLSGTIIKKDESAITFRRKSDGKDFTIKRQNLSEEDQKLVTAAIQISIDVKHTSEKILDERADMHCHKRIHHFEFNPTVTGDFPKGAILHICWVHEYRDIPEPRGGYLENSYGQKIRDPNKGYVWHAVESTASDKELAEPILYEHTIFECRCCSDLTKSSHYVGWYAVLLNKSGRDLICFAQDIETEKGKEILREHLEERLKAKKFY